ncbi:MAG: lysophospholipid acyltransferase family protein [Trichormus sp.]
MMEFYFVSDTCPIKTTDKPINPKVAVSSAKISPWLTPLAYFLGHHFVLPCFFGDIKITGQENIPKSGPVILAPTHRARWDSLLLPYAVGRYVTGRDLQFMVTINECQGLQGWFVRRMGGFAVNPQHPTIATLRHAVEVLEQEQMLVIYPEGNIFRDGKVHQLKPGIARLALSAESHHPQLGVKIIPVGISYSEPYPSWGADVSIKIGSPIHVKDYTNGQPKHNAKRLTQDLTSRLEDLTTITQKATVSSHS